MSESISWNRMYLAMLFIYETALCCRIESKMLHINCDVS